MSEIHFESIDSNDERVAESDIIRLVGRFHDVLNPNLLNEIWHRDLLTKDAYKDLVEMFEKKEGKPVPEGQHLYDICSFSEEEFAKKNIRPESLEHPDIVTYWLRMLNTASEKAVESFKTKKVSDIVGIYLRLEGVLMFRFPSKTPYPKRVQYAAVNVDVPDSLVAMMVHGSEH